MHLDGIPQFSPTPKRIPSHHNKLEALQYPAAVHRTSFATTPPYDFPFWTGVHSASYHICIRALVSCLLLLDPFAP
jgi:hypothetical protein